MYRYEIMKALELCASGEICADKCPYNDKSLFCARIMMKDALDLIKELLEENFRLEMRLKEVENGYEQTLYLERLKIHDFETEREEK